MLPARGVARVCAATSSHHESQWAVVRVHAFHSRAEAFLWWCEQLDYERLLLWLYHICPGPHGRKAWSDGMVLCEQGLCQARMNAHVYVVILLDLIK